MKKYLFGLSAIVLAIGFSAFTAKPFFNTTFRFNTTLGTTASLTDVQDESLWNVVSSACSDVDQIACSITVDDTYTHTEVINEVPVQRLNTTIANTPAGENMVSLNATTGATVGGIQQYKITSGTGYTFANKAP